MGGDTDYGKLVEETVETIKEHVRDNEVDIDALIAAEKEHKNRSTLIDWLAEHAAGTEKAEGAEEPMEDPGKQPETDGSMETVFSADAGLRKHHVWLGTGLIAGLVVASLLFVSGVVPVNTSQAAISADEAGNQLNTYIVDNQDAFQLPPDSSLTVQNVAPVPGADMYRASLLLTATVQNNTIQRDVPAYMTEDGRYVFISTHPVDTSQPLATQLQQLQGSTQSQ